MSVPCFGIIWNGMYQKCTDICKFLPNFNDEHQRSKELLLNLQFLVWFLNSAIRTVSRLKIYMLSFSIFILTIACVLEFFQFSKNMTHQSSPQKQHNKSKCFDIFLCLLVLSYVLLLILVCSFIFISHPNPPIVHIKSVQVLHFNITSSSLLTACLRIQFSQKPHQENKFLCWKHHVLSDLSEKILFPVYQHQFLLSRLKL